MKLIVLAAGKGTRFYPFTKNQPKALVLLSEKKLIDWVLLPYLKSVSEIIFIINDSSGSKLKSYISSQYKNHKTSFVTQGENDEKGTLSALEKAKELLKEGELFCVCNCDDLLTENDVQNAIDEKKPGIGVSKAVMPWFYLGIITDPVNSIIKGFRRHKKTQDNEFIKDFYSNGFHILDTSIFKFNKEVASENEYGLPQTLFANLEKLELKAYLFGDWQAVNSPEDLEKAKIFISRHYGETFAKLGND